MKVLNDKISEKIKKYHEMCRNGEDTTAIRSEIYAYTNQYVDDVTSKIDDVKKNFEEIKVESKVKVNNDKSIRKDYLKLIDEYRRCMKLAKDISDFKRELRELKK